MRVIVLLKPTNKRGTKTAYTKFRKALRDDGFLMIAPEVYMRVINNRKALPKHMKRLEPKLPTTGTIAMLTITEKQWRKIVYLVGEIDDQEKLVGGNTHVIL